ncbi:MAG: PAAR domain-containing protein [Polyangiaceae bacterium]
MPSSARLGDHCTGHSHAYPPRPLIEASANVSADGIRICRVEDALAVHPCACGNCPPHGGKVASGSASVTINTKAAARVGDPVDCGSSIATGSAGLVIGDASARGAVIAPAGSSFKPPRAAVGEEPPHVAPEVCVPAHVLSYAGGNRMSDALVTAEDGSVLPVTGLAVPPELPAAAFRGELPASGTSSIGVVTGEGGEGT